LGTQSEQREKRKANYEVHFLEKVNSRGAISRDLSRNRKVVEKYRIGGGVMTV